MTTTLISLISIVIGIVIANLYCYLSKTTQFSFTSVTILAVFGSIFMTKLFGQLGLSPTDIVKHGNISILKLLLNFSVAGLGGVFAILIAKKILKQTK